MPASSSHRSALSGHDTLTELAALAGLRVVAAIGHVVLFMLLYVVPAVMGMFDAPPPPEDVIQVSLVSEAYIDAKMVQMPTRTETAPTPTDLEAPDPVEDPGVADEGTTEPVETPNPSDLAFQTPDAKEVRGDPDNRQRDADREARKRELMRQALLDSAVGSENNPGGDPDSTSSERIDLGGNGIRDPEAARYIEQCRRLLFENFNPLPQLKQHKPSYSALILVRFDVDTGVVQSWSWARKSGNASWDAAAERAVESVTRLPPPPDRVKPLFENGFKFNFVADE